MIIKMKEGVSNLLIENVINFFPVEKGFEVKISNGKPAVLAVFGPNVDEMDFMKLRENLPGISRVEKGFAVFFEWHKDFQEVWEYLRWVDAQGDRRVALAEGSAS